MLYVLLPQGGGWFLCQELAQGTARLKAKTVGILVVESSSLEVFKRPVDVAPGTWFSGEHSSAG